MPEKIRRLTENDAYRWKTLRLEALKLCPEAFSSSYEQEQSLSDDQFQQRLKKDAVFGAFKDDILIGTAGFLVFEGQKLSHKGRLYGMYLKEEFRGKGTADALVKAVIDHARGRVRQIQCSVISVNAAAIKLYRKNGFEIYGTERDALRVGEHFYDDYLMALVF